MCLTPLAHPSVPDHRPEKGSPTTAPSRLARALTTAKLDLREALEDPVPNLLAGLTAAVVALPLALAFGLIAFGPVHGPAAGLWSAILVGFVAAAFGGATYAITGPTVVLAVFTGGLIASHGGFGSSDALLFGFLAVALSGVVQVLFGALRLAKVMEYIPYPVIAGYVNGVALLIFWSGLKDLLSADPATPDLGAAALAFATGRAVVPVYAATLLALGAVVLTLGYPRLVRRLPERGVGAALRRVPGSLLALVLLTLLALASDPFATARRIGELPAGLPPFALDLGLFARHPEWGWDLALGALGLATISSMDTLLAVAMADGVLGKRTPGNRELVAQGVGNTLAGAFGASQACGAAVRTMVNIRNGGRTRLAGVTHSLVLLALFLAGAGLVRHVPLAVLSGILFTVAIGMVDWRAIAHPQRTPRPDLLVMLTTLAVTVVFGLLQAILIGVVLAAFLFIKRMSELTDFVTEPEFTGSERAGLEGLEKDVLVYEIHGPLFFGAANRFTQTFDRADLKGMRVIVFRMNSVVTIDETGLRQLETILDRLRKNGQTVVLSHVPERTLRKIERYGLLVKIGEGNVVGTFPDAVERARAIVGKPAPAK